jgi:hypothetical protein
MGRRDNRPVCRGGAGAATDKPERLTTMTQTITLPKTNNDAALQAELALLRAENAKMKEDALKKAAGSLTLKVSPKRAVSLIGMGRFPVTLYKQQWLKLNDIMPSIMAFIVENDSKLSQSKDDKPAA